MYCEECDCECYMLWPNEENPEKKFRCPRCTTVYVGVDLVTEEDLKEN